MVKVSHSEADDWAFSFIEAMEQDAPEVVIAKEVASLCESLNGQYELFQEVGEILGSRYRNAIKDYLEIEQCLKKTQLKGPCGFCVTRLPVSARQGGIWCIAKGICVGSNHCK